MFSCDHNLGGSEKMNVKMIAVLIIILNFGQIWAEEASELSEPLTQETISCDPCELSFCQANKPANAKIEATTLFWHLGKSPLGIPLVTSGPVVPNSAPVYGTPGTKVVLGESDIPGCWRGGGRYSIRGKDCKDNTETEMSYFWLYERSHIQRVLSNGLPDSGFLAIPFINALTHEESSSRLALPGSFAGTAEVVLKNWMQGAEVNGIFPLPWNCADSFEVRGLIGFRYWNFQEKLTFSTNSHPIIPSVDVFKTKDRFQANNNFYGGQVGFEALWCCQYFSVTARTKLAIGCMCERGRIKGSFLTNYFFTGKADPALFPAGYFALPTNKRPFTNNEFALIPEVNVDLLIPIFCQTHLRIGYTCLYANQVLRPGREMSRVINPTQAPAITAEPITSVMGEKAPKPLTKQSSVWAQGVNVGIEFSY